MAAGGVILVLALVGGVAGRHSLRWPLIAAALAAAGVALGTTLHWGGQRVLLPESAPLRLLNRLLLADLALPTGQVAIPLPSALLYRFVPFFDALRVFARFAILFQLALTLLAALGIAALASRWPVVMRSMTPLLILLVVAEGWQLPYVNFTPVRQNERPLLNATLRTLPPGSALIEYPLGYVDKVALYQQQSHGHPIANGYQSFDPPHYQAARAALGTWPQPQAVPVWRAWGVDYVVVSGNAEPAFQNEVLPAVGQIAGLCPLAIFAEGFMMYTETHLYAVQPTDAPCPLPKD